jgi:hypothetical protein
MPVFIALNHLADAKQVNIEMGDEAVRGVWSRLPTSSATLDYEGGEFLQIIYAGSPVEDRQLRGPDNSRMLVLKNFVRGVNRGVVEFDPAADGGSFGTESATWTRLFG